MKKRTTLAAAFAVTSIGAPAAHSYSNNQQTHYVISMAMSYCMTEAGRLTTKETGRWFNKYMRDQGVPYSFVTRMHRNIPATQIASWIRQKGGCSQLVAQIDGTPSSRPLPTQYQSPSEVLSDTPFRF